MVHSLILFFFQFDLILLMRFLEILQSSILSEVILFLTAGNQILKAMIV